MANRDQALSQARASLSSGEVNAAANACARLLLANPTDLEARYLQGRCRAALGRWGDAAADFRRVLAVLPQYYPALVDIGIAQAFAGDYRDSMRALRTAESIDASPAELHFGLGLCALGSGDLAAAERGFQAALARNPSITDAYNNLGVVYDRQGRLQEAINCFRQAATLQPGHWMVQRNLGDALLRVGDPHGAATAYRVVAQHAPDDASVHAGLGAALLATGDFAAAILALRRALELDPTGYDAAANLGEALRNTQDLEAAASAFERCLALRPETAEAHLGLGRVSAARGRTAEAQAHLRIAACLKKDDAATLGTIARLLEQTGARAEALELLDTALAAAPLGTDLHDARGELLARSGRWQDAVDAFERTLALDPMRPQTLLSLGASLESLGSIAGALEKIQRSLVLRPQAAEGYAALASCAFRICDWDLAEEAIGRLRILPDGLSALHPFVILAADLEPIEEAGALRTRGRALAAAPGAPLAPRFAHERLRIAYLSPDFREHPVAHALVGVIEQHDASRFETVGVTLATGDDSAVGARLRGAFHDFVDASALGADAIAELLREREIDVAIDLAGHTAGARTAVFAARAAAVQINYLGFPGSMGVDFMDFIIADESVITPPMEAYYGERVLRMPNCYLPFDAAAPLACPLTRSAAGLPDSGFVFCAFNNGYKITRSMFQTWMSLLADTPGSVLWLRQADQQTTSHLLSAAAAAGIETDRLVFAPFVANRADYLSRLRCADLFLDTLPYNAHTTAAEALWAGVPVLTCVGRGFAGRVGGSVVHAAGLGELACGSVEEYRQRALELARDADRHARLRERLDKRRSELPLFDTSRYTRDLEALIAHAWRSAGG